MSNYEDDDTASSITTLSMPESRNTEPYDRPNRNFEYLTEIQNELESQTVPMRNEEFGGFTQQQQWASNPILEQSRNPASKGNQKPNSSDDEFYDVDVIDDSNEEAKQQHPSMPIITRHSVGRIATLGDLYDAHQDKFCKAKLLPKIPRTLVLSNKIDNTYIRIIEGNTFKDKSLFANIENELALSIFADLVMPVGEFSFLVDEITQNPHEIRASLLYVHNTETHQLKIKELVGHIDVEKIKNVPNATHFVTEIDYAITLPITFTIQKQENENTECLQHRIYNYLSKLKNYFIYGSSIPIDDEQSEFVHLKIYSQNSKNKDDKPVTLPYSNRTTLEAFKEIEEVLLNLQKEEHRGRRIAYKMHPISNLMEFTPRLNIKNQSFFSAPKPFFFAVLSQQEKFEILLTKVDSLFKDMTKYNEFVKNSHIQSTKNILLKAKVELKGIQENLARFLISNRKGEKTGITSETIMKGYKSLIQNLESYVYRDWMPFYAKIDYVFYLKKKNVQVIGKNGNFEAVINDKHEAYVFFCTWNEVETNEGGELFFFKQLIEEGKTCIFVDQESCYPVKYPNECRICHFSNGNLENDDLMKRYEYNIKVCYATSSKKVACNKPENSVQLNIHCPKIGCKESNHFWYCSDCLQCLEYYDKFFYCSCGKAPGFTFEFKCSDPEHGETFVTFEKNILLDIMSKLQPKRNVYILVLGHSGVGKSTFMNAFANYLSFSSLNEAQESEPVCLVATAFKVSTKSEAKNIQMGESENERLEKPGQYIGRSCTQFAKTYVFETRNTRVHLIDTPGISDTDGIEQDKENIDRILDHLKNYRNKELHGICILMKSNDVSQNTGYNYCINELLSHLHKDAAKNILFCFTHARESFYGPGDALHVLQDHLNKFIRKPLQEDLKLDKNNSRVYSLDNEAIRFLYANYKGVKFEEDEVKEYEKSWNFSQKETARMLNYVEKLESHQMDAMIRFNEIRKIGFIIPQPLVDAKKIIETNESLLEYWKDMLAPKVTKYYENNTQTLSSHCNIVCTSAKCLKRLQKYSDHSKLTIYPQICHLECKLQRLENETEGIINCLIMRDKICMACGCGYEHHKQVHEEQNMKEIPQAEFNTKSNIAYFREAIQKVEIEAIIKQCEEIIQNYKHEEEIFSNVDTRIRPFLQANGLMSLNKSYEEYLKMDIKNKSTTAKNKDDYIKWEALEKLLSEFHTQKVFLGIEREDQIIRSNEDLEISSDEIKTFYENLKKLPLFGKYIQTIGAEKKSSKFGENKFEQPIKIKNVESDRSIFSQFRPALPSLEASMKLVEQKKNQKYGFVDEEAIARLKKIMYEQSVQTNIQTSFNIEDLNHRRCCGPNKISSSDLCVSGLTAEQKVALQALLQSMNHASSLY